MSATAIEGRGTRGARGASGALALILAGALLSRAQTPAPPAPETPATGAPATPPTTTAPPPPTTTAKAGAWTPRYHAPDEVRALVDLWVASGAATALSLPTSRGGRAAPALQFGADGPVALEERPTIVLVGGLDGVSLAGSEAVLAIVQELLEHRATLPPAVTFVAIPHGSPDGLSDVFAGRPTDGRDHLPLDDDGDGEVDEDGPDDVDQDGLVLDMIVEDPNGRWARASDPRFLAPARPGDRPRYRLAREGRDDDHDGRFNEDPLGGVDLDLSFPVGWGVTSPNPAERAVAPEAPLPLDDALTRALADLLLARRTVAVLLFQGHHGQIATRGGSARIDAPAASDQLVFDDIARWFSAATGRAATPARAVREARGIDRPGAALDWIHAVPGAIALEIAAWGPAVDRPAEARDVGVADARFEKDEASPPERDAAPPMTAEDRRWARWLDDTRGGIGFVDWHPVDLGDGAKALVGGFEPYSRVNPPAASLAAAVRGLAPFVERLAASAPALSVRVLEARRDGDVVTLRWRVENGGRLPTGLSTSARGRPENGARAEITLPTEARCLWGDTSATIGELAAGATSREFTTVVLSAPGGAITLRARSPWTPTTTEELRP